MSDTEDDHVARVLAASRQKQRAAGRPGAATVALVAGGLLATAVWAGISAGRLTSGSPGEALGIAVGSALIPAFILSAAIYFFVFKRGGVGRAAGCFAAMMLAGTVGGFVGAAVSGASREARVGLQDEASFIKALGELRSGAAADNDALAAELKRIGWAKLLDASSIASDRTLARTRAKIAAVRRATATFRASTEARIGAIRQTIRDGQGAERRKAHALAEFDRGLDESRLRAKWKLMDDLIGATEEAAEFLHTSRSRWRAQGGKFMFTNRADLTAFARLAERRDALNQQALRIEAQSASAITSFDQFIKEAEAKNSEDRRRLGVDR